LVYRGRAGKERLAEQHLAEDTTQRPHINPLCVPENIRIDMDRIRSAAVEI
jgi:hypothetical protein